VDFGNVRRLQPGIINCIPAGVRSTDMLRLQVDQPETRVAYGSAFTYAGQRNPQKKSGEGELAPSLFAITRVGLGGLPFAKEWSIRALFPNMALSDLARRTLDVRSWWEGRADKNQNRDDVRV